jgi:hypothetical protein
MLAKAKVVEEALASVARDGQNPQVRLLAEQVVHAAVVATTRLVTTTSAPLSVRTLNVPSERPSLFTIPRSRPRAASLATISSASPFPMTAIHVCPKQL